MKGDYQNFTRATNVSLLGLTLQMAMGLALLIYSVLSKDHAGFTGAVFVLIGGVMWLVLAVVYDQHRRERIEAMEAESLSAMAARQTAVFEENAEDLRIAAKRLAWMHKIFVPVASLALAGALIGVGIWRLRSGQEVGVIQVAPAMRGWAIALGLAVGVTGFIFARFVSGMAKQKVWGNLRAGAAAAVGAAIAGLALTAGHFIDYAGSDVVIRALPVALPIALIVLGAEIVLNFVLTIYRPRVPGELPRPAFDSRILGFIAAPDKIAESIGGAINYQFGFDVTGSWFYQLLTRWAVALLLLGTAVVWLMTVFAVVGPDESGLRIRRGHLVSTVGPGLHVKMPWPLETIQRTRATTARRLDLGGPPPPADRAILWTNDHGVTEEYYFVRPAPTTAAADGQGDDELEEFRDLSLAAIEVPLYFEVVDLEKYERFGPPETREAMLRAIGRRTVMEYIATVRVDDLLGRQRGRVSTELRRRLEERLAREDAGVRILFAGIEGVHPPVDTADHFEEVVKADLQRQAHIESAEAERIATLTKVAGNLAAATQVLDLLDEMKDKTPEEVAELEVRILSILSSSEGEATALLRQAKAERWARHMQARGSQQEYRGQLAAYRAAPEVFKAIAYFSTMKDLMNGARVYILSDDVPLEVRTNLEDAESTGNALLNRRDE